MTYRVTGHGGLYPEGYVAETLSANGAIELLAGVRRLCDQAAVFNDGPHELSLPELRQLANAELGRAS